ncbi:MAG: hypothetical protein LKJ80_00980 [Oscillibacter sp.]|jgi:glutaredoxin-related protein|nr:hypothetical protein [Oscillibacter sp.]
MRRIVLYFSSDCPDCPPVKEALTRSGIPFAAEDITSGMAPLKRFLKYRDTRPEFDAVKAAGSVGIPCLVVDGGEKIYFGLPDDLDELR